MTLKQTVRRATKQGNLVPAIVRAVYQGKVTVQLSGNGAVMRMLTLTGGPVVVDQWIHVDFTTNPPLAVAPSPIEIPTLDGPRKPDIKKRTPLAQPPPREPAIEVFPGPPPTTGKPDTYPKASYPVTAAGLQAAADICADGDVIYIPTCDMTIGQIDIPSQSSMTTKNVSNITVIGASMTSTILRGGPVVTWNTVTFRDITFIWETANSSRISNVMCMSDAAFYNCSFTAWNDGIGASSCVENYLGSVNLRFYTCDFDSNHYGLLLNPSGKYDGLVHQYSARYWTGPSEPDPSDTSLDESGKTIINYIARSMSGYTEIYENMIFSINYPMKNRSSDYDIYVKAKLLSGSFTSGSPVHIFENLDTWTAHGGEWPYSPRDWNDSLDNTKPDYINNVLSANGYPYSAEDILTYKLNSTSIPGQYYQALFFGLSLSLDSSTGDLAAHDMQFEEIYLQYSDNTREYLYPRKDHSYCEDCYFSSGSLTSGSEAGIYHIYANTGSLVETERSDFELSKTYGSIIVLSNGHRGVITSGSEPDYTYSGMEWYNDVTEEFYIRNSADSEWIQLALASDCSGSGTSGSGVNYLADLLDVNVIGKDDTEALCYDQASGKWVPRAQLQFAGLAKITVSSGSPANPSVGDLWINTA